MKYSVEKEKDCKTIANEQELVTAEGAALSDEALNEVAGGVFLSKTSEAVMLSKKEIHEVAGETIFRGCDGVNAIREAKNVSGPWW